MAIADTEEKIRADFEALLLRAVALGRKLEKDSLRALLDGGESPEPPKPPVVYYPAQCKLPSAARP